MGTYTQNLLDIDLTTGTVEVSKIDDQTLRNFIGGSGLAAKLFLDREIYKAEPFSEENTLFVMTGPLAGTTLPSVSRFEVCFKSPLTGIWGESSCGGNFAPELKAAGYDGIAIRGISPKPVYIFIDDDRVEIRDASDFWGKDSYETVDLLKEQVGGKRAVRVLTIGQAGENLVKYAAVMNDKANAAGRCGGGAVMGSKRLKAIAVRGTGKITPSLPDEYAEVRKRVMDKLKESPIAPHLKANGTIGAMVFGTMIGDVPLKNWSIGQDLELTAKIDGNALTATYLTKVHACQGCPIATKRVVKVDEGPYQMGEGPGPEYESAAALGSLLMNDNLASICKLNDMCNRYGMDSISCGSAIALAMECFENGLISAKDLNGGHLRWGNPDDIIAMVDKIAHRQGLGDLLAEGVRRAAGKIGQNAADYALEIKGLEVPMHDPRVMHGLGLSYATSNRGACHIQHMVVNVELGACAFPEVGLPGGYQGMVSEGKAEMVLICENLGMLINAAPLCNFCLLCLSATDLLDMLKSTTGFDYDLEEMMKCGDRIWMLKRGMNNMMGITATDDRLPKRIMTAFQDGPTAGSAPDMQLMLKQYYNLRGLDVEGRPMRERLESLGLYDLAASLLV